jgi:hypothetical protein
MVWKNTSKVGFGVKGAYVIAWYCDSKGNVGGAEDYKANIGTDCIKDGYNTCYAEIALTSHRLKRKEHNAATTDIQLDKINSVAI